MKELNDVERKNNLRNAFQIGKNIVKYKKIMLVDDIYTTGSTADEVSRVLMEAGTEKIYLLSICMGQGGDYVGGIKSSLWMHQFKRKAMNSFLVDTDRLFKFYGRINEDVNTYTMLGNKGGLFFTVADISLTQTQTQSNNGGMTDVYLDNGTYVKTFYSVICSPQAVKVGLMGPSHLRMHHKINWNYCTPKILNEKYKKF